jgi:hypothetical protein
MGMWAGTGAGALAMAPEPTLLDSVNDTAKSTFECSQHSFAVLPVQKMARISTFTDCGVAHNCVHRQCILTLQAGSTPNTDLAVMNDIVVMNLRFEC